MQLLVVFPKHASCKLFQKYLFGSQVHYITPTGTIADIANDWMTVVAYLAMPCGTIVAFDVNPQIRLGDDRNGVLETRLWPSISDKMEGQHGAFQEGASLQCPYPLTLQA